MKERKCLVKTIETFVLQNTSSIPLIIQDVVPQSNSVYRYLLNHPDPVLLFGHVTHGAGNLEAAFTEVRDCPVHVLLLPAAYHDSRPFRRQPLRNRKANPNIQNQF